MDENTEARFQQAVERTSERARERSEQGDPGDATPPVDQNYEADVDDPRAKNSRHGQVTADKWNQ